MLLRNAYKKPGKEKTGEKEGKAGKKINNGGYPPLFILYLLYINNKIY